MRLIKHKIIVYFSYVSDVCIAYNESILIDGMFNEFSYIHHSLLYAIDKVPNNEINFLDAPMYRNSISYTHSSARVRVSVTVNNC
jgi:hypothetical protein